MFASLTARLALIAALVCCQALYAGHSVKHDSDHPSECQVCLQTSASGAMLPSRVIEHPVVLHAPDRPQHYLAPAARAYGAVSHPSRAPPAFPV
jgi:hypothetical protein